jgi:outer membrane protein assembly factor BamD
MKVSVFLLLLIPVLVSSCGEYEKLLKSTDYELKRDKAKEYFQAKQYVKSSELLGQVLPRFRATEEAEELNWMYAQSYFGMKQYDLAAAYFKSLIEQYPYGKHAEDGTFLGALCDYYLSPRAELDQENTRNAIEGFTVFINRFPSSPRVEEAKTRMTELRERMVEKSYLNARLYYDMKEYKAAITALSNSLKEFSDSKYREEMMYLKLNSLYLYAENSYSVKQKERYQATLDEYYSFLEEFPQSKFSKEVKKIYQDTARFLKIENTADSLINKK